MRPPYIPARFSIGLSSIAVRGCGGIISSYMQFLRNQDGWRIAYGWTRRALVVTLPAFTFRILIRQIDVHLRSPCRQHQLLYRHAGPLRIKPRRPAGRIGPQTSTTCASMWPKVSSHGAPPVPVAIVRVPWRSVFRRATRSGIRRRAPCWAGCRARSALRPCPCRRKG